MDTGDDGRISKEEFTAPGMKATLEKVGNMHYAARKTVGNTLIWNACTKDSRQYAGTVCRHEIRHATCWFDMP